MTEKVSFLLIKLVAREFSGLYTWFVFWVVIASIKHE